MSTPTENAEASVPTRRPSMTSRRSNSLPFPSSSSDQRLKESESSSSALTSSDKLSALPTQSPPVFERLRTPNRTIRRSLDASSSVTSLEGPSGSLPALQSFHSVSGVGQARLSESDSSLGRHTPRQRNESERSLPTTLQNLKQAVSGRLAQQHSDSAVPSPSLRSREGSSRGHGHVFSHSQPASRHRRNSLGQSNRPPSNNLSPLINGREAGQTPQSRSPAQSRAASPLRILQGWNLHRNHTRDEPFVPVDPFRSHIRWFGARRESSPSRAEGGENPPHDARVFNMHIQRPSRFRSYLPNIAAFFPSRKAEEEGGTQQEKKRRPRWHSIVADTSLFLTDTLPRQVYLWCLLWLPALYWHRVARVFEDAEVSKPEIQRLIDACGEFAHEPSVDTMIATGFATPTGAKSPPYAGMPFPEEWTPPVVSPALARFKNSWELFVDTLMREWKTFNLVSALLCTTILTIFQIEDAAADPITRWSSLMSLIFALMSLSYGCVYIVQFGSMRSMDRASRWAEEAQKSRTAIWWNIWVLLATPAIWLAWSMISFCVAILSFVWRTGSADDTDASTGAPVVAPLSARQALGVRVAITAVFAFGLFNFFMIVRTFSSYSRIAVRRDRRGRFRRGDADRDRERFERGRERERPRPGAAGGEGTPYGKQVSDSMVGLGLTGVGEARASPSGAGVILENVDLEKGEGVYLSGDRVRGLGAVSPKL